MDGRRVLITGIGSHWGTQLASALEDHPQVEAVYGVDTGPAPSGLRRTEHIDADIRDRGLIRLLPSTEVDTIVHCGILWYPSEHKPAEALHDINVIGTLQLLAACERTPTLRSVVVRGSAAIYGCEPAAPSFYTEDMVRRYPPKTRFQRDIGELESYFENFARRRPDVTCCMLRFQPEIAAGLDTPLVRFLSLPIVPRQAGFDPRLQLVHADDATGALVAATLTPVRGPVNVAPSGSVSLTKLLRMARRPTLPIPHPLFGPMFALAGKRLGAADLYGDGVRLLRYGRGIDNARLRIEVGYQPAFDAVGAARDFAQRIASRPILPRPPGEVARA